MLYVYKWSVPKDLIQLHTINYSWPCLLFEEGSIKLTFILTAERMFYSVLELQTIGMHQSVCLFVSN